MNRSTPQPPESFDDRLRLLARTQPEHIAILVSGTSETINYAEIDRLTSSIALTMADRMTNGSADVLVVGIDDTVASCLNLIAALRLPFPIGAMTAAASGQLMRRLAGLGLSAVRFISDHTRQVVDGEARAVPSAHYSARPPAHALILATGGSTSTPRLVVDVHMRRTYLQPPATRLSSVLGWAAGQVQLATSRLPHASALTFFIEGIVDGNTMVLLPAAQPRAILSAIATERVQWLQATPFHLQRLRTAQTTGPVELGSLDALVHTSAACPGDLKRFWMNAIGPQKVYESYGSTEGVGATVVRGDAWLRRPGTVGKGFFTQIRIVDEAGRTAPPGITGDIYMWPGARRDNVYLDGDSALRRTLDGLICIGDQGHLDSEGYLFLAARPAARITVAGETFDAEEIEGIIRGHPAVSDAGVAGVQDERFGNRLYALVSLRPNHTPSEGDLKQWLRGQIPPAAMPRRILITGDIPRSVAGKLLRPRINTIITELSRPSATRRA